MSSRERPQDLVELDRLPPVYPDPRNQDEEPEEAKIPLSQYLWILKRHRWQILGFVSASVIAAVIISARLTPIYESTATIDIDRQMPPGVVGPEAVRGVLNDSDQFLATQVKLVQSDSVLRPIDQRLHLRDSEHQLTQSSAIPPSRAEEAPVTFKSLKVTRPPNTYLLLISYRSEDPQMAAVAANAIAGSYLEHAYNIRLQSSATLSEFMARQIDELKAKMERSGLALAGFERELNVINPEEKTNILSARLLQLNTELTNAQAERLKKEAAFDSVRAGSIEAALATPQGETLRKLVEHRNDAREHFVDIQTHYGASHPEYRRAEARANEIDRAIEASERDIAARVEIEYRESGHRESMIKGAFSDAKQEFDQLNSRSFEYQALKREADADKHLYEELNRKIKEAGINAGFQNSAIRIADPARPALLPVFPNLGLNAMLALLFSTLAAVGTAVVGDALDKTIREPEQVARTLRAEVIGSLPLMKNRGAASFCGTLIKGRDDERDLSGFGESIRTLRNSILLGSFDRRYQSLLVTSAAPGDGKTTTAANLAAAHAEHGQRTLLIDGDLRRPSVHRNFNLASVVGLSNALLGEIAWRDALIRVESIPELYILPAGPPSRRASDLMARGLAELIEETSGDFDLVVLDGPPLLGFAEPLQMATVVDGVIVVARAGQTRRKAVATVLGTLNRVRARTVGIVLNEVHKDLSESYSYHNYYRSYYRSTEAGSEERPS